MNTHITSFLPVKMKPLEHPAQSWYNKAIDDCAAAIERAINDGKVVINEDK